MLLISYMLVDNVDVHSSWLQIGERLGQLLNYIKVYNYILGRTHTWPSHPVPFQITIVPPSLSSTCLHLHCSSLMLPEHA